MTSVTWSSTCFVKDFSHMVFHTSLIPVIVFGKGQHNMLRTSACLTNTSKSWDGGYRSPSSYTFKLLPYHSIVSIFASKLAVLQPLTHTLPLLASLLLSSILSHPSHTSFFWAQISFWPPEQRSFSSRTGKLFFREAFRRKGLSHPEDRGIRGLKRCSGFLCPPNNYYL